MVNLENIIKLLHSVKERKGMYFFPENLESAHNFLSGITCCVLSQQLGLEYPHDLLYEIAAERGWDNLAKGLSYSIGKSNLTEDKKIDELISIYSDALERLMKENDLKN